MNKHLTLTAIVLLLVVVLSTSCQKRHLCVCSYKGEGRDTIILHEYRSYTANEASELCDTDEQASRPGFEISCRIR